MPLNPKFNTAFLYTIYINSSIENTRKIYLLNYQYTHRSLNPKFKTLHLKPDMNRLRVKRFHGVYL